VGTFLRHSVVCFPTSTTASELHGKTEFQSNVILIVILIDNKGLQQQLTSPLTTRMWANAQRDGRLAEYRWRPLLNAASLADAYYWSAVQ